MQGFVSGLSILLHWAVSIGASMPVPHCFDYSSFVRSFKSGSAKCSSLFFFLKAVLALWGPLRLYVNIRMGFSIFAKTVFGIIIGIALNL